MIRGNQPIFTLPERIEKSGVTTGCVRRYRPITVCQN